MEKLPNTPQKQTGKEYLRAELLELPSNEDNKLIIPDNVEKIIRNLCALSPNKEWSGILFYTYEGDFDNGLILTCQDILVLNQGSGTFTEFDASNPEVARYMFEHQLFNCCTGLVHSHQGFKAFFSGTDTNTLLQEGRDLNNFLSLIVNNAGQYEAAITRKVSVHSEIHKEVTSKEEYILFNTDTVITSPEKTVESKHIENSLKVEYFPLRIEKNDNIFANPECEAFSKIISQQNKPYYSNYADHKPKTANKEYSKPKPYPYQNFNDEDDFTPYTKKGDYYDSLFKEYGVQRQPSKTEIEENEDDEAYENFVKENEREILEQQSEQILWDDKEYLLFAERLFFGSPFIANPKCKDFNSEIQYIAKTFNAACSKAFGNTVSMKDWFESSLDYYTYFTEFHHENVLPEYEEYFDDFTVVIYYIIQKLKELPEKYEYITVAIDLLESRI